MPTFNATRFGKTPLTCQCETEDKNAEEFQTLLVYWSFSSDIVAVNGLRHPSSNLCHHWLRFQNSQLASLYSDDSKFVITQSLEEGVEK